ncbi:hypothetical protein [Streptomyces stackebrandtii]|uniref:hypothetical protein n=1 Tax=Streptomyces stackebrandtii TaxID=3051177 RepID=UPI0028DBB252|nr:hypothetical protein [Streptomyces sp. DSM 40976]
MSSIPFARHGDGAPSWWELSRLRRHHGLTLRTALRRYPDPLPPCTALTPRLRRRTVQRSHGA